MTDKERLVELIGECKWWCVLEDIADYLIANGVVVQKQGEWFELVESKLDGHTGEYWEEVYYNCTACDYATCENTPYCPNCGARMVKEDK